MIKIFLPTSAPHPPSQIFCLLVELQGFQENKKKVSVLGNHHQLQEKQSNPIQGRARAKFKWLVSRVFYQPSVWERNERGSAPGGTLGLFKWGCAAGNLEPSAYTGVDYEQSPIFPQGQQSDRNASARENHPTREKAFTPARSTIPEEKWGTTRSLIPELVQVNFATLYQAKLPNPPPPPFQSSCLPETTEVPSTVQPKQNRFDFFIFSSGNSLFPQSRLKSSAN